MEQNSDRRSYSSGDMTVVQRGNIESIELEKPESTKPVKRTPSKMDVMGNLIGPESIAIEVENKRKEQSIAKFEAERIIVTDCIIEEARSKDRALLNVVSKETVMQKEKQVLAIVINLLNRGADPSFMDEHKKTPLHFAVEENFKYVCQILLEYEADPEARDDNGRLPYTCAFAAKNDEIAAMLVKCMDITTIRKMYTTDEGISEFSFHELLDKNMPKTVQAVLDCMMDPVKPGEPTTVYYDVLLADKNGRTPRNPNFEGKDKSGFQIISKRKNRDLVNHDVVRLLIWSKWKSFGRRRFLIHSVFYLISFVTCTLSAVLGSKTADPSVYDTSALQIMRAICEVWTLGTVIVTLIFELNQLYRHRREYLQDAFNWIDMSSCILILSLLPLRFIHRDEQWFVFSAAYLLWTLRIFKYAAVFRQTGAYAQTLWRILIHDIVQFTILFTCILLAFSGCLLLSLRGEGSLQQFNETSSFWSILFVGLRILIEAERIIEYTALQTTSLIIMVAFLFTICVLLLNILIAQVSDTYQKVQQDAQRGLEVNRAWILTKIELNSLFVGEKQRKKHYIKPQGIKNVKSLLGKWKDPSLNEINQHIQDFLEMNFLTVRNRLMRHESRLQDLKDDWNGVKDSSKQMKEAEKKEESENSDG